MENPNLHYEVCRRNGACLKLYGTTIEEVDDWVDAKKAEGSEVVAFNNCESLCDRANNSSTSLENGITGVKVTGVLPNGSEVRGLPAIAVTVNNTYKTRPIR